jgi:hypothetical protein
MLPLLLLWKLLLLDERRDLTAVFEEGGNSLHEERMILDLRL